jgi:hypothetical protein
LFIERVLRVIPEAPCDFRGRVSSVGIATLYGLGGWNPGGGEIFRTRPDRPRGPRSLLFNWYRVFPGGKAAGA